MYYRLTHDHDECGPASDDGNVCVSTQSPVWSFILGSLGICIQCIVYLTVPSVTQISYHYPQCHNANARQHSYEENGSSLRAPGPDADEIIRVDNEPGDCDEDCDSQA